MVIMFQLKYRILANIINLKSNHCEQYNIIINYCYRSISVRKNMVNFHLIEHLPGFDLGG